MDSQGKTVVALGMFDGVHIGHKKLIDTAVCIAKARGMIPAIYTFSNHPQELAGNAVKRLCSNDDRRKYMASLGVKRIEMVEFTREIRGLSPQAFMDMLVGIMAPGVVVAGYNYTFGVKKAGDAATLERLAVARGVEAAIIPPVLANKKPISSTRIRELIAKGDVQQAQLLLGRAHAVSCIARGPCNDLPAISWDLEQRFNVLLPGEGSYICLADAGGSVRPAMAEVRNDALAIHIWGLNADIENESVTVRFIRRIRPARIYASKLEAGQAVLEDVSKAKQYFGEGC